MRRFLFLFFFAFSSFAFADQAPQIRLTLQQGVPVTSADITGAVSVCLEPYQSAHNQISVYDGVSSWTSIDVVPSTYCLSSSGLAANTNYDVYVANSAGLPQLSWSAAWSNDTTPPARALQDGIDVLAVDHTKRLIGAVHVGSIAGQLTDSHACRCLSNYYNAQPRDMWALDPTPTWSNSTGTGYTNGTAYQQAHGNAANQLEYIAVVPRLVIVHVQAAVIGSAGSGAMVGIGLDGSLGDVSFPHQQASIPASLASNSFQTSAEYAGTPGLGRHEFQWLEHGFNSGTTMTWLGYIPPWQVSGMNGGVMN